MIFTNKKNSKLRFAIFLGTLTLILGYFVVGSVEAQALIWLQVSDPSAGSDHAYGLAVHSSGVYIIGNDMAAGDARWRIEKRNRFTGSPVWTQVSNPSGGSDYAYGVAVDATGVYIAGYDSVGGNVRWRIEKRSHANGALLWAVGSNPSVGSDQAYGVAVNSAGLYVVGYDSALGNARWRIERRNTTTGALISWAWSNPSGSSDIAEGVAVDATGVYIVGYDMVGGNARWRIEKRSLGLAFIWTQASNPSTGLDYAYGVAASSTGLYVVGYDSALGNARWRIERRNTTTGALLTVGTSNPSAGSDIAYGVAVGVSGVYVVGYDMVGGNQRWRFEKRNLGTLALIWVLQFNPSAGDDRIWGVGIDTTGIYIAGYDAIGGDARWRIEKRMPSDV